MSEASADERLRFAAAIAQPKRNIQKSMAPDAAAAVERIRAERKQVVPTWPADLYARHKQGAATTDDDIVSALHGLRHQLNDPAIDWLTMQIEHRMARTVGAPSNESIAWAREYIAADVRRRQAEIKQAGGVVVTNGRKLRVAPLDVALQQVSDVTGIPEGTLKSWLPKKSE